MSLDVTLYIDQTQMGGSGVFIRENGRTREITRAEWDEKFPGTEPIVAAVVETSEVCSLNITHNLKEMAEEAGIYDVVWRPEEHGIEFAHQLIEPLRVGLELLKSDPARFKEFNAPNGWGVYENLVGFVSEYLTACMQYPNAKVHADR